jgi:hypothetical protein
MALNFRVGSAISSCAIAPDGMIVVGDEVGQVHFFRLEMGF